MASIHLEYLFDSLLGEKSSQDLLRIYRALSQYSMPILLGAASLAVYAWLNSAMTASVAFTSLAVFTKLEYSLSVMPNTITELLDARISIKRIQQTFRQFGEAMEHCARRNPGVRRC